MDIPPYFKEYMEQKFNDLHSKIDNALKSHDSDFMAQSQRIDKLDAEVRWANQKIWIAIGALSVMGLAGTFFASYFKQLNQVQLEETITPLKNEIQATKEALIRYEIKN